MSSRLRSEKKEVRPALVEQPGRRHPDYIGVEMPRNPTGHEPDRKRTPLPKHPGIYRRGDTYEVSYRDRGRQRWRAFRTLTEAKRFKRGANDGDRADSREPFSRYAERWLANYTGRTAYGIGQRTRDSYADSIRRVAMPFFGTTSLERIDAPLLRDYIVHLAKRGYAPSSVRRHFAPVRALLATAHEDGLLRQNPAYGLRVIVRGERKRKPRRLTPEQTGALLGQMPVEHADLAYVLAATGMRISEALGPCWADLTTALNGKPVLRVERSTTKTDAGERLIPLTPETVRRLLRRRAEARFATDGDPIFPSSIGTPMDAHNYRQRVFKPAARRAGLPWATPHMLRHGLASLMAERGYSPAQIAAHLGHADGGVLALREYVHPALHEAPAFVDDVIVAASSEGNAGGNNAVETQRIASNDAVHVFAANGAIS